MACFFKSIIVFSTAKFTGHSWTVIHGHSHGRLSSVLVTEKLDEGDAGSGLGHRPLPTRTRAWIPGEEYSVISADSGEE